MRSATAQVPGDGVRPHVARICSSTRSAVSRSASSRSAVRLPGWKKLRERALGRRGHVDLALVQALEQLLGRQVDQLDLVGAVEDAVGDGLAHAHAGDLRDDVVQALEVLDVDRGVDVDAGVEQLLDVVPALRVPAAGRVRVRELVDQDQLGPAREDGVEVHLARAPGRGTAIDLARDDLEPVEQRLGLGAAVRLDDADDDVDARRAGARAPPASMAYVLPTPGAAPKKILRRLRCSRAAASSSASGAGRRRCSS